MPEATGRTPQTIPAESLGAAWLQIAARILAEGQPATYDGLPMIELVHVALDIAAPDPDDPIIAAYGDPARLAWMRANFTDHARVAALGDADSYATRLYDYGHSGRDQVAWVIERLRRDPHSRSATITTFQPLTDTSYIPCVSLLDFWRPGGALELVVYAHSIDFGAKGYGNLVELAALQRHVAAALAAPVERLVMIVKSAHIYDTERDYMASILAEKTPG
jgi:thymidylate synthase